MFKKIVTFLIFLILLVIIPPGGFSAWSFTNGLRWFYLFIISFLIFNILYPFVIHLAFKINAIDWPGGRKIHTKPTPRIGGVAIYFAFLFTVIRNFQFSKGITGILIGSSIIFLVGFIDDIKGLSAETRMIFQLIAALVVVCFGVRINLTPDFGRYHDLLGYIISVVWLIGITNAFNFMDGIDGLAASMGLVISVIFLFIVVNTEQYKVMFITSSLTGALSAFLIYNWHPAKVFLGDSGSTMIGFILACLGIYCSWADSNPLVSFSAPMIILFIPIFDLIYTTFSRIKNKQIKNIKQWLEYTGRDHIHHRLISIGFSVENAVIFIVLINLLCGLIAVNLVVNNQNIEVFISILQVILVFTIIVIIMLTTRNKIGDC